MPFCKKCGRGLPLDADFCSSCGTRVEGRERAYEQQNNGYNNGYNNNGNGYQNNGYNANNNSNTDYQTYQEPPRDHGDGGAARRQSTLDHFYLRLKWERIAWSIASKVFIILGAVFFAVFFILMIVSIADGYGYGGVPFVMPLTYMLIYCPMLLGIGIVNYIMVGKVQRYMDGLYRDCGPAVQRGESVGMIVFCYFFNTVALVFYLINFIQIKCNREDFEEIRRLQMNSNQGNVYWQ